MWKVAATPLLSAERCVRGSTGSFPSGGIALRETGALFDSFAAAAGSRRTTTFALP